MASVRDNNNNNMFISYFYSTIYYTVLRFQGFCLGRLAKSSVRGLFIKQMTDHCKHISQNEHQIQSTDLYQLYFLNHRGP